MAGCLEAVPHPTQWCSKTFFVEKPRSEDGVIKARLVTDLRPQNQNIMRVGIPLDGSSHILKRLEPEDILFAAVDLTSGYHQVAITPESRDY